MSPKPTVLACCKQAEVFVWRDDLVLIKQGQFAVFFQNALDHEHNVGAARVVFIKHDGSRVAQRPRQNAFVEFSNLFAVFQFDRVFTDQINPADMAIKIDPHAGQFKRAATCSMWVDLPVPW